MSSVSLLVDGLGVKVPAGATILDACDEAGVYVPRLCFYPGLACCSRGGWGGSPCGICVVRLDGGGTADACEAPATPGLKVSTDDEELRRLRWERLAVLVVGHPRVCLTCPQRHGCSRDQCSFGHPPAARCCDESGRCELGQLIGYVDPEGRLPVASSFASRETDDEGPVRREPGLCVGCGRCVTACETGEEAGRALEMETAGEPATAAAARSTEQPLPKRARPKKGSLRASGCTFCARCVLVCPTGALTPRGEAGKRWLARRKEETNLPVPVLPPKSSLDLAAARENLRRGPGVLRLLDGQGRTVCIAGVPDLRQGLERLLSDAQCAAGTRVIAEEEQLYTQRESEMLAEHAARHGCLPPGNDIGDGLFDDEDD